MKPLPPGHVSMLILLSSVAWTKQGRLLAHSAVGDLPPLYNEFTGASKRIADTILAIHERNTTVIKRNRRYCVTAWAFVKDSIWRRYWPTRASEEDELKQELKKLKPLYKLVKPYLVD